MQLSPQFEKALIYATRIHGGQLRKKTRVPYVAHILGVAAIAMEYGANETEAIAALLHDAVEDCGGAKRLRDIERKFGKDVARIVEGCTTQIKRRSRRIGTKEGLCRARSARADVDETRLGFGQTAQCSRDTNGLSQGRGKTLDAIQSR